MKIGIFADTHYCGIETLEQNRKPRRAYDNVKAAFDEFKRTHVDLVICMGDLVHYNDGIQTSKKYLENISAMMNSYSIPCYICMGNHDNEVFSREDFQAVSGIMAAPCTLDFDGVRLILLDASYTPDGKPFGREHVDWTLSYVPENQLIELESLLTTEKNCVLFIHQNIDVNVEKHHIVSNANEINAIIAKHKNVSHVYQGHYHYGAENVINSIPYTTIRSMCIGDENNYKIIEV